MFTNNNFNELRSVRDLIRYAISNFNKENLFFGHGNDNSFDEAIYLVSYAINIPSNDIIDLFMDASVTFEERNNIINLINKRIKKRIPIGYLTNEAWLQGYKFYVDERVIIPRSFISELLIKDLNPWIKNPKSVRNILDLCTGSGCLAIMASFSFPNAKIMATDVSNEALNVAKKNIFNYALEDIITTKNSNVFEDIKEYPYDIILCNPPYVNNKSMQSLPIEYTHEPKTALDGGIDGMDIIRKIIEKAAFYLNKEGLLILEIGNEYENFQRSFPNLKPTWLTTTNTEKSVLLLRKEDL
ncbi:putative adenine-specific DNA-methyltransferase [Candidatus Kinetoplastibacterium desouzaii TCC079E]|uniref:Putative adenine-specific DNA-methyltransferase n=1 Tax=Candidatus Kinetoplastidibacterium desouzai TCC079E TaxID=1208919 RepID=M1LM46_9PROT|nr:50S ribosomal protein L3 N(5)-glutamine methyltransferase [Candidatus Kinetoplastibacterium desouzaii]AGF46792.1 putative adenine-specific DNA-methyltransferase [Candidatus Kinetoplastibacterium desouzaii TCC079E]